VRLFHPGSESRISREVRGVGFAYKKGVSLPSYVRQSEQGVPVAQQLICYLQQCVARPRMRAHARVRAFARKEQMCVLRSER
jgi:hypothetical protein